MNDQEKGVVIDISKKLKQELSDTVSLDNLEFARQHLEIAQTNLEDALKCLWEADKYAKEVACDAWFKAQRQHVVQASSLAQWSEHDINKMLGEWDRDES